MFKMGEAIRVILIYVGLPLLVLGVIVGMLFQYNLNSNREANYKVTELCVGKSCSVYENWIKSGHEICKNLFVERGIYLNGGCFDGGAIKNCLKNNDTYQECIQKYGGDTYSIISRISEVKTSNTKHRDNNDKLSLDLNSAVSSFNELKATFDSFFPDVFYCYEDVEYSYETEEVNTTEIAIEGSKLLKQYRIEECALCNDGDKYEIRCSDDGYWRVRGEWEWNHCKPCENDGNQCLSGTIKTEVVTKIPINVTVKLGTKDYSRIDLKDLSQEHRVKVFEQIKDDNCYTTLKIYNDERLEDITTLTWMVIT